MDVQTLIQDAKARFNHNSAKVYLQEKYKNKLIVAYQGGLWNADMQTINFLSCCNKETIVIVDTFGNPVKVIASDLLQKLSDTYETVMNQWYEEYKVLENKR